MTIIFLITTQKSQLHHNGLPNLALLHVLAHLPSADCTIVSLLLDTGLFISLSKADNRQRCWEEGKGAWGGGSQVGV